MLRNASPSEFQSRSPPLSPAQWSSSTRHEWNKAEAQLLDADFSWMRECKAEGARNPRTTRTSCSYDFTRGQVGSQKGAPLWMEGRGRWLHVRQGSARVPCLKGRGNAFLVLRVPFRKSGGGTFCNAWTLSAMVKFSNVGHRGLLSTGGWDQFTKLAEGDDEAQLVMNDDGCIGSHGIFGVAMQGRARHGRGSGGGDGRSGRHPRARCQVARHLDQRGRVGRCYPHTSTERSRPRSRCPGSARTGRTLSRGGWRSSTVADARAATSTTFETQRCTAVLSTRSRSEGSMRCFTRC